LPAEIKLSFSAAPMPADRSVIGFNLYRTTSESQFPYLPLNRRPIIETTYPDSGLERNIVYRYRASTIVRLASGAVVESLTSDKVSGMLKDDEL
jgi:hypothetical protein